MVEKHELQVGTSLISFFALLMSQSLSNPLRPQLEGLFGYTVTALSHARNGQIIVENFLAEHAYPTPSQDGDSYRNKEFKAKRRSFHHFLLRLVTGSVFVPHASQHHTLQNSSFVSGTRKV
ncbi:hypothetical protein V8E51_010764 [Hyaloscypha variabilis]|jgi:hypothetical protein|uniref:Uncharacterized protein n=1 Tax=Hyaloscypha variabilis (strain UAMH 11265 / GT02V1 / F) TaxID=1149755 RepID=A0A2J6SB01_HYAVF|nr:hypothetical protein L207DRAFT_607581 [Hyaloscypha variabilis F]